MGNFRKKNDSLTKAHRFESIDSLRGIAAFVVVLHHFFAIYDRDYGHDFEVPEFFNLGFYGVELFFIISGFVIYYTILQTRSSIDFIVKRFIRLYPTYWICIFITFIAISLFPLGPQRDSSIFEVLVNMTMLNGLVGVKAVDPSYWSLQIELFFYLLMATLLFTGMINRIYLVMWAWLLLILVYNEVQRLPGLGALLNLNYGSLFISGICFYRIKVMKDKNWQPYAILVLSYMCTVLVLRDLDQSFLLITIIYLLFTYAVFGNSKVLKFNIFIFLGNISYALYLIHQNVGFVIMNQLRSFGVDGIISIIIAIILCLFLAWCITKYFEKPVMRKLREAWAKRNNLV